MLRSQLKTLASKNYLCHKENINVKGSVARQDFILEFASIRRVYETEIEKLS